MLCSVPNWLFFCLLSPYPEAYRPAADHTVAIHSPTTALASRDLPARAPLGASRHSKTCTNDAGVRESTNCET
jgi:hypothetical protein